MKDKTKQSGLEGKRLWRHPWSDIDDVFERGVAALPEPLFFQLQEYNQVWHFSERRTVHYIWAKVQKSQMNNFMYPLSPYVRSGSCFTTRLSRPCCGSGWRPGTFINRWPRSLRRAKMVTRHRPLNSPCWGKQKCPRKPPQPWLLLDGKVHKELCMCAYVFLCLCVWPVFLIFPALLLLLAVCVSSEGRDWFIAQLFALSFLFFISTWPDWDCEMWTSHTITGCSVPVCVYCFKQWWKKILYLSKSTTM